MLLDGVGDVLSLKRNRETLQGRPKVLKGGRSQTMCYAYPFTLSRRAVVVTMDLSAANLDMLATDHWLSDSRNVKVLRLTSPAWQGAHVLPAPAPETAEQKMRKWSAAEVRAFLSAQGAEGPAASLFSHGVRGKELVALTVQQLTQDLRMSKLAAQVVLELRDTFLQHGS